jgi:hypothetical protein
MRTALFDGAITNGIDIPIGVPVPLLTARDKYELVLFRRTQNAPLNNVVSSDGLRTDVAGTFIVINPDVVIL